MVTTNVWCGRGLQTMACATVRALADWALWVRISLPRPMRWLLTDPRRMLTVAWLIGLIIAGSTRAALADSIIVGPDLAHGAPKTLFETYDFLSYKLTVKPDEESSGWFDLGTGVLQIVGFINNLILWASLGVLYGALTLLQWLLNLTLYRDSAPQIDAAAQMVATHVFWPLIAATVAIGAFLSYARWRGEGRSFMADLGWVIAAGAIGMGFASGPSRIMDEVDSIRQDLAAGVIAGSTQFVAAIDSPTGFPTPTIGGNSQEAGARKLADSLWATFGATPWCLAEFRDLSVCKVAGAHALADDDQWKAWMKTLDDQGAVPEFREYGNWIRGQDMSRTGYLLLLAAIAFPMGLMLLRLVMSGLVAVGGLLLMLVGGLVFLTAWPIPGWFRQAGTRYFVFIFGLELQGLFITVVVAADMVASVIIATQLAKFGYFLVAVLNLAVMAGAMKAKAWLDTLIHMGGAGSMGLASYLIMRSAVRTVVGAGTGLVSGGATTAGAGGKFIGRFLNNRGRGPGWGQQPGAKTSRWGTRQYSKPRGMAPLSTVGATATRYRGENRPTELPGFSGRHISQVPVDRGRTIDAAHRRQLEGPRPEVVDQGLSRNVAWSQATTGRHFRVWVDKRGTGLVPLTRSTPPTAAELGPRRRVWADKRGTGLVQVSPAQQPRLAPFKDGAHQINTGQPPRTPRDRT